MDSKRMLALGGSLVLGLAGVSQASDLSSEVQALRAEVAQLRQQQSGNWMNERRAEEVKALVREVLADADTRASLMDNAMTAGHNGKNFFLASEDGTFLMNIAGQVQFRYIANFRDNSGSDDAETGFQMRRAKVWFDGFVADPKIGYKFIIATDRNTGNAYLEEMWMNYKFTDEVTLTGGRFKAPFSHEEMISTTKQMAVEPTLVNGAFTTGYVEGVMLTYQNDMFRVSGSFNDGSKSGESSSLTGNPSTSSSYTYTNNKDFSGDDSDIAFTARADYKVMGDWKSWEEYASWSSEKPSWFVGAAGHYEKSEYGDSTTDAETLRWTVDTLYKNAGWSLYGAAYGSHISQQESAATDRYSDWGLEGQVAYMVIADKLEPFVRYELITADKDRNANTTPVNILTVGANYYLKKQNAKFTLDVVWAMDPLTTSTVPGYSGAGYGLLSDATGERHQMAVRAQFQLLF